MYTKEQEHQFENYVRQFSKTYKVQRGEDDIWEIPCKHGDIEPYSLTELCCYQSFPNRIGINRLKEKLPEYCTVTQDASSEIVFKFPNDKLTEIADIVKAKKRRHLSEEHKAKILHNLKPIMSKPKTDISTNG